MTFSVFMTRALWLPLWRKYDRVKRTFHKSIGFCAPALLFLGACDSNRLDVDVSDISAGVQIEHFADAYYGGDSADFYGKLPSLREMCPEYFVGTDSLIWVDRRFNTSLVQLYNDSKIGIPEAKMKRVEAELENGFKHLHYYFPNEGEFTVFTYISNLFFSSPVLVNDSTNTVFIGLDLYLGIDHPAYKPVPEYIARRFNSQYIAPDVFGEIALEKLGESEVDETLIHDMIRMGIARYFQEAMLPTTPPHLFFGYSKDEFDFCTSHEVNIYTYFVENQLLFDSSIDSKRRFMFEAPFSKFYADIDNESPGRVGEWLGWKIVHSYMDAHPNTSLDDLLSMTDYETLFRESRYKPVR